MVGRISCFSAFRPSPKKHGRNGVDLPSEAMLSGFPPPLTPQAAVGARGPGAPPLLDAGPGEIPGGLAGIRERMAAMGHFVMTDNAPAPAAEEESKKASRAAAGVMAVAEPPSKRKKTKPETDSQAGLDGFALSADIFTEDRSTKNGSGSCVGRKRGDNEYMPKLEAENEYLHESGHTLFPARNEVQKPHASHFRIQLGPLSRSTGVHAPLSHGDELMFEADGHGETEAERLLNAFALPGRAPAVVKRPLTQKDQSEEMPQAAHFAASATASDPSHQRASSQSLPHIVNTVGTSKHGPVTAALLMEASIVLQGVAADEMSSAPEHANQSQRMSAISQLITTQGIRPSEIRGQWAERLHFQPSSPGGRQQKIPVSTVPSGNTPRTPDSASRPSSGPSPARGPAASAYPPTWRDSARVGSGVAMSSSSVNTARSISIPFAQASPRDFLPASGTGSGSSGCTVAPISPTVSSPSPVSSAHRLSSPSSASSAYQTIATEAAHPAAGLATPSTPSTRQVYVTVAAQTAHHPVLPPPSKSLLSGATVEDVAHEDVSAHHQVLTPPFQLEEPKHDAPEHADAHMPQPSASASSGVPSERPSTALPTESATATAAAPEQSSVARAVKTSGGEGWGEKDLSPPPSSATLMAHCAQVPNHYISVGWQRFIFTLHSQASCAIKIRGLLW